MKKIFYQILAKSRFLRNRINKYQELITFAEANETDYEIGTTIKPKQMIQEPGVLLVVGNKDTFSQRIIDYALEMSQRMSQRIVALNVVSDYETINKLKLEKNNKIQEFEQAAEKRNISFEHIIRCGEIDSIVRELDRNYGGIEFIISKTPEERISDQEMSENKPEKQLCIYTMA